MPQLSRLSPVRNNVTLALMARVRIDLRPFLPAVLVPIQLGPRIDLVGMNVHRYAPSQADFRTTARKTSSRTHYLANYIWQFESRTSL
jgi:hypothetical protein